MTATWRGDGNVGSTALHSRRVSAPLARAFAKCPVDQVFRAGDAVPFAHASDEVEIAVCPESDGRAADLPRSVVNWWDRRCPRSLDFILRLDPPTRQVTVRLVVEADGCVLCDHDCLVRWQPPPAELR